MPKPKFPISDACYASNPNICPFCGSSDIEGDDIEQEDDEVRREMECRSCEKEWLAVFELAGYRERRRL